MDKNTKNEKIKKQFFLDKAFESLKKQTGIDHKKVILGDEKEKKKLKFKQYQEKMKIERENKETKK